MGESSRQETSYEAGFGSNALTNPQRIVFITKKTSAKVKGDVGPQLMAYPHVILREAIVFQVLTIALVIVGLFWDAPLEQLANPLLTPNPAKAPWYFLGLQELLHYFPPLVAGIIIPSLVVVGLVVIPYFHVNVRGEPLWSGRRAERLLMFLAVVGLLVVLLAVFEAWTVLVPTVVVAILMFLAYFAKPTKDREFWTTRPISWWVMTWFITVAMVLTVVGTFFRGPGWSWVWPWRSHGF